MDRIRAYYIALCRMNPVEELRTCQYLYLHAISEPEENEVRLILHEARSGGAPSQAVLDAEPNPQIRKVLSESRAIEHGPGCRVFEVHWESYIAYSVQDESFARPEPATSVGAGRLFVEYTKSEYLDYLSRVTIANHDYPGPFKHWAINCLNHCVDVASTMEPAIEVRHAA